jgi:exocyst complex component 2
MIVMASPGGAEENQPPLLPSDSDSLATAHYLMRILGDIQDSVNELNGMEISNEISASLKNLLESTRWRFDDVVIRAWLRGEFDVLSI